MDKRQKGQMKGRHQCCISVLLFFHNYFPFAQTIARGRREEGASHIKPVPPEMNQAINHKHEYL